MINTKNMNLSELSVATRNNLKSLGYCNRTLQMMNHVWNEMSVFLAERKQKPFISIYGLEFLHERIGYPDCLSRCLTPNERDYIRAIRTLISFQENGQIPKALNRNRVAWYAPIQEIRDLYIKRCNELYPNHSTRRSRIAAADRFMQTVVVGKSIAWKDISEKTIAEYSIGLSCFAKGTVEVHLRGLKKFMQFLYDTEIISKDLSNSIPQMSASSGERIPHMLSSDQVNMLLNSIDRGNPIGKRNYAIVVMAACLGMRDSDITNLKFENIDWEKNTISFFQKKTNRFIVLPLLPIVGETIIDYLKNGRPYTESQYIFVKHRPPFEQATSFYTVMRTVLENSDVKLKSNFSKGLHILRHSLASELVRQGESYNTVSTILGHASIGSTNAYTHIDIDGLFKCALELTEVSSIEF